MKGLDVLQRKEVDYTDAVELETLVPATCEFVLLRIFTRGIFDTNNQQWTSLKKI